MAYYTSDGADEGGGKEYLIRLVAQLNNETWIYTYPPKESASMIDLLADQVQEGKVPYPLASVLMDMVVEGMDASL